MKRQKSVKEMALDAACGLLDHVPRILTRSAGHELRHESDQIIDGCIEFEHGPDSYALIIQVKPNGAPRFVRSAVYQLKGYLAHFRESGHEDSSRRMIPMLISPYFSPESRSICGAHDVAFLDLVGNARIAFDDVYIDRTVADRPKFERRSLRSLFSPKAAAILRVLLRDPAQAWNVTNLAEAANASLGHVSNVRRALLDREWAEKRNSGISLARPDALLRTWRKEYRQSSDRRISGYTFFHGNKLNNLLAGNLNAGPDHPRAVYASNSAAQWIAPFTRDGTHRFYADEPGAYMLKEILQLANAEKGANVIVRVPRDESLFEDAIQSAPGIFCTSPVVAYLDLWNGSDRDREAADQLASKCFPWL